MEDCKIVELYLNRDETAIEQTAQKYGKLCHKIAHNITRDACDAEECVNDTYLGLWQSIPPQRPDCFRAFVAKIARNLAIRRLKYRMAEKRSCEAVISLSELEEIIPEAEHFEEASDQAVGQWIGEFLYAEKEEVRMLFIRKYWYFDSIAELSLRYGYSETKIKSILFRTRKKLRAYLLGKGVAL